MAGRKKTETVEAEVVETAVVPAGKMEFRLINPTEDGFLRRIQWNKEELEAAVRAKIAGYENVVYTEENIKAAKNDRAELNKLIKEFVKGVTVGEATAEENTQPAVSTVETNEEETKQVIRANEEDFIAGLIAAADFASDEEETQRIEIVRNGKLAFAFSIRPLGSEEYPKIGRKNQEPAENEVPGNTGEQE